MYMDKEINFWTSKPSRDSSWYWKNLHKIKEQMRGWYIGGSIILQGMANTLSQRGMLD